MTSRNDAALTCLIADAGRTLYDGPVFSVILPGEYGVVEVLQGHSEAFVKLQKGDVILWQHEEADAERHAVEGGIAHVRNDRVVVLF